MCICVYVWCIRCIEGKLAGCNIACLCLCVYTCMCVCVFVRCICRIEDRVMVVIVLLRVCVLCARVYACMCGVHCVLTV